MRKLTLSLSVVVALTSLFASAQTTVTPRPSDYKKHVTRQPLQLLPKSESTLRIERVPLPGESPFVTDADFIVAMPSIKDASATPVAQRLQSVGPRAMKLPSTLPTFQYMPLYDSQWQSTGYNFSLWSYNPNESSLTQLATGDHFYAADMGVIANGTLYSSVPLSDNNTWRFVIDLSTLSGTRYYMNGKLNVLSSTYDHTTGTIYACVLADDASHFYLTTFDPESLTLNEEIASYEDLGMSAMGVTKKGQLVGVDQKGSFYHIDKTTGERTLIREQNLPSSYNVSGCCDLTRDIFYFAYFSVQEGSYLVAYDIETGYAQVVKQFPRTIQAQGLWIPEAPFDDAMPGEPSDLKVEFIDDALQGTISFKLPETLYSGENAPEGEKVDYEVLLNDRPFLSGEGDYGETITLTPTIEKRGVYTFTLKVSNEAGYGQILSESCYVGYDDITNVTNATMEINNGNFILRWSAPKNVHGGYYNPAHISYDVIRYPGEVEVGKNLTTTSLTVPIEDLPDGSYYFDIITHYYDPDLNEMADKPAVSTNASVLGSYKVPFSYDFTENPYEASKIFHVENTNKDESTWVFTTEGAQIAYNAEQAMDDWLISMPIEMKGSTIYTVTINVSAQTTDYPETVEIKAGYEQKASAMTIDVAPATTFNSARAVAGFFIAPTDGIYYIGIHGISDPDMYVMTVKTITVDQAGTSESPGAPTDLTLSAYYEGNIEQAKITVKAPEVTAVGEPLDKIDYMQVSVAGEVVGTIDNVTPGQTISYDYNVTKRGSQAISVSAVNEHGIGIPVSGSVFVGYGTPLTPDGMNTRISQADDNTIELWWNAVTHDVNGRYINRTVWYQPMIVFQNGAQATAGNGIYAYPGFTHSQIHERYASLNPNYDAEKNDQFFVNYYFSTYYYEGTGLWEGPTHHAAGIVFSDRLPVGKAYALPWKESFADCGLSGIFNHSDNGTYGSFTLGATCTNPSAQAYDGDGGMLIFVPERYEDSATLSTGRIDLREAVTPQLSFYYFSQMGSMDQIIISATDCYTTKPIVTLEVGETSNDGWEHVVVDLDKFRGQVIQLMITAKSITGEGNILLDNFEILDPEDNNLKIGTIEAPSAIRSDREFTVTAPVTNNGHYAMAGFKASLYVNDEVVETADYGELAQGATTSVEFKYTAKVTHTEGLFIKIGIEAEDDANPEDNETDEVLVEVIMPGYPAVQDLVAEASGDNEVALSWSRPTGIGDVAEMVNDNIESYPAFSIGLESSELGENDYVGNWTIVDGDKLPVIQIANKAFTNNRTVGEDCAPKAWIVYNHSKANVGAAYATSLQPHSGNQCFVCPAAVPEDNTNGNDDWLISPLLSGKAQTVNFFAKAQSTVYGQERFEVLYSTTDTDIDSFTLIETYNVDDQWHSINANLPEGAKYFAIRCTSYDAWALMVDDITYEAGADESLQLSGFNVYRNRNLLVTEPVNDCTFVENGVEEGVHDYHVSAVYNLGESALSNTATVDLSKSGLDSITVGGITVAADNHAVVVTGADGLDISITAADGKTIAATVGSTENRIPVATPGVYLVKVGNLTVKVAVK